MYHLRNILRTVAPFALPVLLSAPLAACISSGGSGSGGNESKSGGDLDGDRIGTRVDGPINAAAAGLENVTLATSSAEPFDRVRVEGLPEGIDVQDIYAELEEADSAGAIGPDYKSVQAILQQLPGDEGIAFVVPPVIDDPQTLRVKITDGEGYSQALSLDVSPLPQASREDVTAWVDDLENMIQSVAKSFGIDYPDDLQEDLQNPGTVSTDERLIDILRMYDAVANPDNEDSLRNLDLSDDEVAYLGGMIQQTGLTDTTNAVRQFIEADPEGLLSDARSELAHSTNTAMAGVQAQSADIVVTPFEFNDINNVVELAEGMQMYADLRESFDTWGDFEDVFGTTVDGMLVATVAGSGGTSLPLAAVIKGALSGIGAVVTGAEYGLVFLPCCIDDIRVTGNRPVGDNREIIIGREDVEEAQFEIFSVDVDARSDPYFGGNVLQALFERAAKRTSNRSGGEGGSDGSSGSQDGGSDNGVDVDLNEEAIEFGASELFEQLEDYTPDVYFLWEGIDVTDVRVGYDEYLDVDIDPLNDAMGTSELIWEDPQDPASFSLEQTLNPDTFFGSEDAVNILRVALDEDEFPTGRWSRDAGDQREQPFVLRVNKIDVYFIRAINHVEEGEEIEIQFRVRNSIDPDYEQPLELEGTGQGQIIDHSIDGGLGTITYKAPESIGDDFQDEITVVADSDTGVRQYQQAQDREATAYIVAEPDDAFVEVAGGGCLEPGETKTLQANVIPESILDDDGDSDGATVNWEVPDRGHINPDANDQTRAVFSATENTGQATVRVTVEKEGDVLSVSETEISVSENCACFSIIDDGRDQITTEVTDNANPMAEQSDLQLVDGQPIFGVQLADDPTSGEVASVLLPSGSLEDGSVFYQPTAGEFVVPQGASALDIDVDRESLHRVRLQFNAPAVRVNQLAQSVSGASLNADLRPRIVNWPGEITEETAMMFTQDVVAQSEETWENVVDRGDHFEHTRSGVTWTNCD